MEKSNKSLWVIVGIALGLVIAMLGMLIYNNYVDNKEDTDNKTEENNLQQEDKDSKIADYEKVDINKQNFLPIYEKYEIAYQEFYLNNKVQFIANYFIDNNKLYIEIENQKYQININNPKKIVVGEYDSQVLQPYLFILTTNGDIYKTSVASSGYNYKNKTATVNQIISELNSSLEKVSSLTGIDDISAIRFNYQEWTDEWNEIRLTFTTENTEWVIIDMSNTEKYIKLEELFIPIIGVNKNGLYYNNSVQVKYIVDFMGDIDVVLYIDMENYLYMDNTKINDIKVKNIYKKGSKYADIIIEFEDGTLKNTDYYFSQNY